jgi:DNA polymerase-3 subunit delta'
MPIIPIYGHVELRTRLLARVREGALPQSLLLHGAPGVGKQRLALWLAQALLCRAAEPPCGACQHCRYVLELTHPDMCWVFPRPRPRDSDDLDDVSYDMAEARQRRLETHGLYPAPPTADALFVSTVRLLVRQASKAPAIAARKVFIVGDADRMVPQEGSEFAANAFLKLLEEPPADTWVVVTTSAASSLLPTIRSRLVAVRVPHLDDAGMRAFLADTRVAAALDQLGIPASPDRRLSLARGAPGSLLSSRSHGNAMDEARRFLDAAIVGNRADLVRLAFVQGHSGARGGFSDVLDALTLALHERMRESTEKANGPAASAAGKAIDLVEEAKRLAEANVSPQLISARLLDDLSGVLA